MEGFKYQIGDVLMHRLAQPQFEPPPERTFTMGGDDAPRPVRWPGGLLVVGRIADECPGGMQRHYRVRSQAVTDLIVFHEEELIPYERPV